MRSTRTLTPSAETVSRSSVPARMRMPSAGIAQEHEQPRHRDDHHRHHEHAIAGEEEELVARAAARAARGTVNRHALRAPDVARAVLEDEGEAEGEQQAVERIAAVERADQDALDDEADHRRQERRDDSAPQKPI